MANWMNFSDAAAANAAVATIASHRGLAPAGYAADEPTGPADPGVRA